MRLKLAHCNKQLCNIVPLQAIAYFQIELSAIYIGAVLSPKYHDIDTGCTCLGFHRQCDESALVSNFVASPEKAKTSTSTDAFTGIHKQETSQM
jgi:hypothetical protein